MIRPLLFALALLATPSLAHEQHHDAHLAESHGVRAVHAWANATNGAEALVFVEIENRSENTVVFQGAQSDIATAVQLVGLENRAGELRLTALPVMPVPAGADLVLAPNGLALQLTGLVQPLREGEHFEIELEFEGFHLETIVEIESATARQHSHAGHAH